MHSLDDLTPHAPTLGGMCSGAQQAGQNLLFLNGQILEDGAVGVRIAGPVQVDAVVSQGCRPIGETLLVTKADGNRIAALSGQNALDLTREMLNGLPEQDKEMLSNGLFLGVVVNEYQSAFGRGVRLFDMPNHDVRGVLEAVPETPLAGFFAQGEFGPIGGRSFIHGHTLSVALFRPLRQEEEEAR